MTVKLIVTVQAPDAGEAFQFAPDVTLLILAKALHSIGFTHQGSRAVALVIHDDGVISAATSPDDHRLIYAPPRSMSPSEALFGKFEPIEST